MNGSISFFVNFVTTMNNNEEHARLMARQIRELVGEVASVG